MHNQTNGLRSDDDAEDSDMVDDDEGITEDDSGIGCWATATEDGIVLEEEDDDQDEDILDTTRVNIQTVVTLNKGGNPRKVDSFDFGKSFALDLIRPYLRKRDISGISHNILMKMYLLTQDMRYLRAVMRMTNPRAQVNLFLI